MLLVFLSRTELVKIMPLIWLLLPLASGNWQAQVGMALELGYAQKKPKRKKNDLGTGKGMWH